MTTTGSPAGTRAIEASSLDSGAATEVGVVRRLTLGGGGGVIVERLLSLDDAHRHLTYNILESPFDVRRYIATMRVAPVTDTGHTFAEWWAEYDAEADDEARLTDFFSGAVFGDGLAALKERFG